MKKFTLLNAWVVRLTLAICISISIGLMYYVNVVQSDYYIYSNPDGPDKSEG